MGFFLGNVVPTCLDNLGQLEIGEILKDCLGALMRVFSNRVGGLWPLR